MFIQSSIRQGNFQNQTFRYCPLEILQWINTEIEIWTLEKSNPKKTINCCHCVASTVCVIPARSVAPGDAFWLSKYSTVSANPLNAAKCNGCRPNHPQVHKSTRNDNELHCFFVSRNWFHHGELQTTTPCKKILVGVLTEWVCGNLFPRVCYTYHILQLRKRKLIYRWRTLLNVHIQTNVH